MKLLLSLLLVTCILSSCYDWCPGIPEDFEKDTEKTMPDEYDFPYKDFVACHIKTRGFSDSLDVRLEKTKDEIVPDTSFQEICEGGFHFKCESHFLKFSDNDNQVELSIWYNDFDEQKSPELRLTGVVKGHPFFFHNINHADYSTLVDSTRFRYLRSPDTGKDEIGNADKNKFVMLEFEK